MPSGAKPKPIQGAGDFQLPDAPGFLFRRLDSLATYLFLQASGQSELSPRQFGILLTLYETGALSQGELSDLIHIDRSTLGEIIRRMAAKGLIERRVPAEDRRKLQLSLTPAGRSILHAMFPAAIRTQEQLVAAIPKADRALVLRQLKAILDKYGF